MKKAAVTVRDVAREAGVHPGTVSRVLNPETRHLISSETALRVEQVAERLGYEPNRLASGLRTRRSFSVGVIISDLTNPLFPPMVRGIEDAMAPHGYTALVANTDSDPEREKRAFETLATRQVDGLIVATSAASNRLVSRVIADGTAMVLVNRTLPRRRCYAVTPDDEAGAAMVADYLVSLGHREIGHLAGPQDLSPGVTRHRSFATALQRHGIELPDDRVFFAKDFSEGAGHEPARQLAERADALTAIFAANDLFALDCVAALGDVGRRVPKDISVVGFNDMPFADRFAPPLTTVHFSHHEVGVRAGELLLEQLGGAARQPRTVVLDASLIERGSAAPPAKRRRV